MSEPFIFCKKILAASVVLSKKIVYTLENGELMEWAESRLNHLDPKPDLDNANVGTNLPERAAPAGASLFCGCPVKGETYERNF